MICSVLSKLKDYGYMGCKKTDEDIFRLKDV